MAGRLNLLATTSLTDSTGLEREVSVDADGRLSVHDGVTVGGIKHAIVDDFGTIAVEDFESGTWTPTLTPETSGTITLESPAGTGKYRKIGDLVYVDAIMYVDSVSSPVGYLTVGGLPFEICADCFPTFSVFGDSLTAAAKTTFACLGNGETTTATFFTYENGVANEMAATVQAGSLLAFTGFYITT